MRKIPVRIAALTVAALGLTACGGDSGSSGGSTEGADLVIVRPSDSTTMDMTMAHDNDSIWVAQQMFETLYEVTPDGQDVQPHLATDYTLSDDQLTYTFTLRDDVTFSNGDPMTAADAKFSIDQASSTDGGWEFLNAAIASVEAPDDTTLVVTTSYPWAPLIADLANFSNAIVPADYAGRTKEEFYEAPVGTGPFVWDHWDEGSELQLVANEDYWDGAPGLDSVTWKVVADDNARNLQLQGGEAQINQNPPFSSIEQLEGQDGVNADLFESTRTDYILMNQAEAPFDDVHVRRAVSLAIDREAIIDTVLFGNGEPANSIMMPSVPFYDAETPGLQYDMAAAKAELAQSSVPGGFTTTFLASSGDSTDSGIAQILQASLAELGITVDIENVDPSTASEMQQSSDYSISHSYWTMDIADPDELITFAVDPEAGGANSFFTGYNNPDVIADAQTAAKTFDDAERQRLYSEIQAQTAEDAFLAPLYYSPFSYAHRDEVAGFLVYPTGNYHLEDVTLTD